MSKQTRYPKRRTPEVKPNCTFHFTCKEGRRLMQWMLAKPIRMLRAKWMAFESVGPVTSSWPIN